VWISEQIRKHAEVKSQLPKSLVAEILQQTPNMSNVQSTQWGDTHEEYVRDLYASSMGVEVKPCGTRLHPTGVIGATPDGIRSDGILIEIKCPYAGRDRDILDTLKEQARVLAENQGKKPSKATFFFDALGLDDNGEATLKTNHMYYDQVSTALRES
jgi:hypothetical protein